jgi:hypothetical protein
MRLGFETERFAQEAPMNVVSSFAVMLQGFAVVMTANTLANFSTLVSGWIFAPRRNITSMIVAAGMAGVKHHSSFHRVFSAAQWSLDAFGLAVFRLIEPWLDEEAAVMLAVDDTLVRKRGLKVFGAGMHHDPLLSSRSHTVTRWGLSFVVLSVIVRFPLWPDRPFSLPVLVRLYLNKKQAKRWRCKYRTRPELAVELLNVLCNHRKNRRFHVVADSAYGGASVLSNLPANCDLTSRLGQDARLYDAPPERTGNRGRPRVRGDKLPTPGEMLDGRARRQELNIYGRCQKFRICDMVARVFKVPDRPLRIVAVEALAGGRGREAFYSTCVDATAVQLLLWYSWRWSIEVTFHDSKQHLGFEQPQGWTRKSVQRTCPMALLLYSLVVLWFVEEGHRCYQPIERPWYPHKPHASFADMLATLRKESARELISTLGIRGPGSQKITRVLDHLTQLAA